MKSVDCQNLRRTVLCAVYALLVLTLVHSFTSPSFVFSEDNGLVRAPKNYEPLYAGLDFSIWRHDSNSAHGSEGTLVSVNNRTKVVREYKDIEVEKDNPIPGSGTEKGYYIRNRSGNTPKHCYYDEVTDKMYMHNDIGGRKSFFEFIYPVSREKNIQYVAAAPNGPTFLYNPATNKIIADIELTKPKVTKKVTNPDGSETSTLEFTYYEDRTFTHNERVYEVLNGSMICRYSPQKEEIGKTKQVVKGVKQTELTRVGDVVVLLCNKVNFEGKRTEYIAKQDYVVIDLEGNIIETVTVSSTHRYLVGSDILTIWEWKNGFLSAKLFNNITFEFDEVLSTNNPKYIMFLPGRIGDSPSYLEFDFTGGDSISRLYKFSAPTEADPEFTQEKICEVDKFLRPLLIGMEEKYDILDSPSATERIGISVVKDGILARSIKLLKNGGSSASTAKEEEGEVGNNELLRIFIPKYYTEFEQGYNLLGIHEDATYWCKGSEKDRTINIYRVKGEDIKEFSTTFSGDKFFMNYHCGGYGGIIYIKHLLNGMANMTVLDKNLTPICEKAPYGIVLSDFGFSSSFSVGDNNSFAGTAGSLTGSNIQLNYFDGKKLHKVENALNWAIGGKWMYEITDTHVKVKSIDGKKSSEYKHNLKINGKIEGFSTNNEPFFMVKTDSSTAVYALSPKKILGSIKLDQSYILLPNPNTPLLLLTCKSDTKLVKFEQGKFTEFYSRKKAFTCFTFDDLVVLYDGTYFFTPDGKNKFKLPSISGEELAPVMRDNYAFFYNPTGQGGVTMNDCPILTSLKVDLILDIRKLVARYGSKNR